MKVLHAVNYHRLTWGTDRAWDKTIQLSRDDGIDAAVFARDSRALPLGLNGKVRAFDLAGFIPLERGNRDQSLPAIERAAEALRAIDERRATGKIVLEVRPD